MNKNELITSCFALASERQERQIPALARLVLASSLILAMPALADAPQSLTSSSDIRLWKAKDAIAHKDSQFFRALEALYASDTSELKRVLASGQNWKFAPDGARPLLHIATILGAVESVDILLAAGADKTDLHSGATALDLARSLERWDIAALISDGGDSLGSFTLLSAIEEKDAEALKDALSRGADPNLVVGRVAPLVHAVLLGEDRIIDLLLASGADTNVESIDGTTPLLAAFLTDNPGATEKLLHLGADPEVNVGGLSLIHAAVVSSEASVQHLLDFGVSATTVDENGGPPADLAAALGKVELAESLGGSLIGQPRTTLLEAISAMSIEMLEEALNFEDPNQITAEGLPYLHLIAANTRDVDLLRKFAKDDRTKIDIVDTSGRTVVEAILSREDEEMNNALFWALFEKFDEPNRPLLRGPEAKLLSTEDADGRSLINRILIANRGGLGGLNLTDDLLQELSTTPDGTGVTPLETAVIVGSVDMVRRFVGNDMSTGSYSPSLQDIARADENWDVLATLPYDKVLPEGFELGASREVRMEMQRRLTSWGYYQGTIDGDLGPQSREAMKILFDDIEKEIQEMGETTHYVEPKDVEFGSIWWEVTFKPINSWCTWQVDYIRAQYTHEAYKQMSCTLNEPELLDRGVGLTAGVESYSFSFWGVGVDATQEITGR